MVMSRSLLLWIGLSTFLSAHETAKILLIPSNHGGHVHLLASAGVALKQAGHDVYELVSKRFENLVTSKGIHSLVTNLTIDASISQQLVVNQRPSNSFVVLYRAIPIVKNRVREIMEDSILMARIKAIQFDLAIMDSFDLNKWAYLIPYKLSIPYVSLSPRPDPWTSRISALPSVEGLLPITRMDSLEDNIFHRIINLLAYSAITALQPQSWISPINDDSLFNKLIPEKENIGLAALYLQSEMVFVNSDIICLDETRVSAPHYKYIGGLSAKPAQPLPPKLDAILEKVRNGVILLSFGSVFKTLPNNTRTKIFTALEKLDISVITRHDGSLPENLPSNIHAVPWLPQNDILAHPKTRLFITHAGNNGQQEAVYHGVPMIMMPGSYDQFYNARRAEARGYGKTLHSQDFTSEELIETIIKLTENNTFYDKINRCSRILKSLPSAEDTLVFWIGHLLQFGSAHLKPHYLDMPLWKFFMLDIALLGSVLSVLCLCLVKVCCVKLCLKKMKHQKTD